MKRLVIVALVGALVLSVSSCGKMDIAAVTSAVEEGVGNMVSAELEVVEDVMDSMEDEPDATSQATVSENGMSGETEEEDTEDSDGAADTVEGGEADGDGSNSGDRAENTDEIEGQVITEESSDEESEEIPEVEASDSVTGTNYYLDSDWEFAGNSVINSGCAVMYRATSNRNNIVVGVNAGHGTSGGSGYKTYSHPDQSAKVTGGTTGAGAVKSTAVSGGMTFDDGTLESSVTLRMAQILRDKLLAEGYDVLMVRDGADVQLDNVARTVICNNVADCHIALHWDGDGLSYDKGCFYCSVPDGIKGMYPVSQVWQQDDALGEALVDGLSGVGCKINGSGHMAIDLTQTSYSKIPSVDIELGNAASAHDDGTLGNQADGLVNGINAFFKN